MKQSTIKNSAGFSLLELMIAMTVLLVLMGAASKLLTNSLRTRVRENQKSDALADAQRVLNIMSREIANSGYGLTNNGIVAGASDSNATSIHIRANYNNTNSTTTDQDEDVTFAYQPANLSVVRFDRNLDSMSVLATRINSLQITYLNAAGTTLDVASNPSLVANATKITLAVGVTLQAANQPASSVILTSDVTLRNAPTIVNRY